MPRRTSPDDAAAAILAGIVAVGVLLVLAILWRTLVEVIRIYRAAAPGSRTARNLWRALGALGCAWGVAAVLAMAGWPEAAGLVAGWSFLAYTLLVIALDCREKPQAQERRAASGRLEEVLHWPVPLTPSLTAVNGVHP